MRALLRALAVLAVVATAGTFGLLRSHVAGSADSWPPPSPSYLVIITLDGGMPDYLTVPGIPHVQALIRNGTLYRNAWAGILESETPSGHASITTGSQPRQDGILAFDWANQDNVPVNLFSPDQINNGTMEHYMRLSGAPTIAGRVHAQNPRAKVVALSGYKYYAADAFGGPNADVIMYYSDLPNGHFGPVSVPGHVAPASIVRSPDLTIPSRNYALGEGNHLAMMLAARTFDTMRQQVTLINLPEFDWPLGHNDGADHDRKDLITLMQGFDRDLASLESSYKRARVLQRTLFVLTADHGFTPVYHRISHWIINKSVEAAGAHIVRDTYHTAAYVWLDRQAKAPAAAANIVAKRNPHIQSVYYRTAGPSGPRYVRASDPRLFLNPATDAANQYLLSTFNGPNGPDIVAFTTEHTLFMAGAESTWKGDHGGADWNAQHLPLVFSGPGIRRGATSDFPARLMDIAPTALSLMGVPATGMQGTPLADAMVTPPDGADAAQARQLQVLQPVVTALATESQRETATRR